MEQGALGAVFLTGLTTGALSCLAVQGGLLASSVANQAEEDLRQVISSRRSDQQRGQEYLTALEELNQAGLSKKQYKKSLAKLKHEYRKQAIEEPQESKKHIALPIVLFLASKLVAYTILGFLLGWAGSVLQLTPYMRAGVQIAIGIFMLGTALRMFNVHPIFRYFSIEPPKKVTRYIRRKAKSSDGQFVTPIFLGTLTVLIPCGVTTAMMALAVGSGSPVAGALIMAAFTIGTGPLFFSLAYFATKLGEKLQTKFLKVAGATILALGLFSIEGGLNLAGSSFSFAAIKQSLAESSAQQTTAASTTTTTQSQPESNPTQTSTSVEATKSDVLKLTASYRSYTPSLQAAKAGQPYKLEVTSDDNGGCGRAFVIPALGIQETLPENGTATIDIPAQKPGKLRLTCAMGMYNAVIQFN